MGNVLFSEVVGWALAGCAGLVTISKAVEILVRILRPNRDIRGKLAEMSKVLESDGRRLNTLESNQAERRKLDGVMCRVLLAQLNHTLSGNDVVKLREARDELNDYLTKR